MKELSDAEISRQCRQGDPVAWRVLVERHTPMVLRLAFRLLRDQADAQDACQEVFMRVMRSFDTFDPTRPLNAWIGRITYHVCLRMLERTTQRNDKEHVELTEDDAMTPAHNSPESMTSRHEAVAMLDHALDKLPTDARMLVLMRYREEFSESEMAEATELPIGTIKTKLHRARKKLKALLLPSTRENER